MKPITLFSSLLLSMLLSACQNQNATHNSADSTQAIVEKSPGDQRPKDELIFLNKAKAEYNNYDTNVAQKDIRVMEFNKYATDSLRKVVDWEMIVTDINYTQYSANSFAQAFFDMPNNAVYNLELVAPITFDRSVDTIAIDNRVQFIYTIPKIPKSDSLKKQLSVIQSLKKGDIIIACGAISHIDENLKVNFAPVFDKGSPWEVDLLATSLRKKSGK